MTPCLAVIDPDVLSSVGLRTLLGDIFSSAECLSYSSVEDFVSDADHYFVHFFVRDSELFAHIDEFDMLKDRTFVLCAGPGAAFLDAGFRVLDTTAGESAFVKRLLQYHAKGHPESHGSGQSRADLLSAREKEILVMLVKGMINKEIADRLDIAVSTVISHRNNLCAKIGTRSIGRLTLYAVLSGLVDTDAI